MFSGNERRLERLISKVQVHSLSTDPVVASQAAACSALLSYISEHSKEYDMLTPTVRDWEGGQLEEYLGRNQVIGEGDVRILFRTLARFEREHITRRGVSPRPVSQPFFEYYEKVLATEGALTGEGSEAEFFRNGIPRYVAQSKIDELHKILEDIDQKIKGYDGSLDAWSNKVKRYEENLQKHYENYNFVGLSKAFSEMLSEKEQAAGSVLRLLMLLGFGMVAVPVVLILLHEIGPLAQLLAGQKNPTLWAALASAGAIEALLIYFFRVVLHNWHSLKAQLLQLQLRKALCAFIEGYSDYAKSHKDSGHLARFEGLIFSGLVADPGKLPSTYDGLEPLLKLAQQLGGKPA